MRTKLILYGDNVLIIKLKFIKKYYLKVFRYTETNYSNNKMFRSIINERYIFLYNQNVTCVDCLQ